MIADLHINSKYSLASNPTMDIPHIYDSMKKKGITLIATGGFTYRPWLKELRDTLKPCRRFSGVLCYKDNGYFILQSEFTTVHRDKGKLRKIRHVVLAPSFDIAEQINDVLGKFGDSKNKTIPTLNCSSAEFVESVMEISHKNFIFPADIWNTQFGALGSKSGYDSLEDTYKDQVKHIHAFEIGISSSPKMNWMVSALDKFTSISNSDAYFPKDIGKEASIFNLPNLSYDNLVNAIKARKQFTFGKNSQSVDAFHFIKTLEAIDKKLSQSVLQRINALADRPLGYVPKNAIPFLYFVPLKKVISRVLNKGENTALVREYYNKIISYFGNEINVFLSSDDSILISLNPKIAKVIKEIKKKNKW